TFNRETHRPSAEKVWQQPAMVVLPTCPGRPCRSRPLEEQEASYLAASARIFSLSSSSTPIPPMTEHLYHYYRTNVLKVKREMLEDPCLSPKNRTKRQTNPWKSSLFLPG